MTIVAGFRVHNGILLCADSQYGDGSTKVYKPKLCTVSAGPCKVVFALSGCEATAWNVIQRCQRNLPRLSKHTLTSVFEMVREIVHTVHLKYVISYPQD